MTKDSEYPGDPTSLLDRCAGGDRAHTRVRGNRDAVHDHSPAVAILGTDVVVSSGDEVLSELCRRACDSAQHIAYANAHSLNLAYTRPAFFEALGRCDLVLNDGIGLRLAARMRGMAVRENLNGSDFTWRILELAQGCGWTVFLYGGRPGVAEAVRAKLQIRLPELQVVGTCDGYTEQDVSARIARTGADLLLVALGQPEQELWLDHHLHETGCVIGVGVGAFFDFVCERVARAPAWMNRLGLEWTFRLAQEPRRLWRRYLIGNPVFLWRAWRLRHMERSTAGAERRRAQPPDSLGHPPVRRRSVAVK